MANFPAIYQWSDFVKKGGLMSYGLNRDDCYKRANQIATDILNGHPVPPVWHPKEADFELVVSKAKAIQFNRWPLPSALAKATIV